MNIEIKDLTDLKMKRWAMTVEVDTVLTGEQLKDVQSIVIGCVRRKDVQARSTRCTIKKAMPRWVGHDVRGTINGVEVKLVGPTPEQNGEEPRHVGKKRPRHGRKSKTKHGRRR